MYGQSAAQLTVTLHTYDAFTLHSQNRYVPVQNGLVASVNVHETVLSGTVPCETVPRRRGGLCRYRTVPLASVNANRSVATCVSISR